MNPPIMLLVSDICCYPLLHMLRPCRHNGTPSRGWQTSSNVHELLVQNNCQKGLVDLDFAVVLNEAQLPELVHE